MGDFVPWMRRMALLADGQCPLGHGSLTPLTVYPRVGVRAGRPIDVGVCPDCEHGWRLYRNELGMIVEYIDIASAGGLCGTAQYMLTEPFVFAKTAS